jgi:hypothetical protein
MTETPTNLSVVREAQMPRAIDNAGTGADRRLRKINLFRDVAWLASVGSIAFVVVFIYIGVPIALLAGNRLDSLPHAMLVAAAVIAAAGAIILGVLHSTNLDIEAEATSEPDAEAWKEWVATVPAQHDRDEVLDAIA